MLQGWHIGVVIPARNEEEHVASVIEGLPSFVDIAVVVDDGSDDTTAAQAKNANAPCELAVLDGDGKGVGSAIDMGHQHLLSTFNSMFISVVMAGDGQMNPNDMASLLEPIFNNQADHVKGSRLQHPEGFNRMPTYRQRASKVLAFFTTLAAGQPISDPQCGYTATSSEVLRNWNWQRSWSGYGYPNFWLVNLATQGYRIAERPVQSIYRNERSGIKPIRFFLSVGWMMAVEHHRRNLAWLKPKRLTPHTLFAFFAYFLGWSALLPFLSNDLEQELFARGVPAIVMGLFFWTMAHLFDRAATRVHKELRRSAPP
tara:strand:- start:363 stop:1304 length:942 start_codon:yes stop_codon:yes gene_type:complete